MHARQVKDTTPPPECHHKCLITVGLARPVLETFLWHWFFILQMKSWIEKAKLFWSSRQLKSWGSKMARWVEVPAVGAWRPELNPRLMWERQMWRSTSVNSSTPMEAMEGSHSGLAQKLEDWLSLKHSAGQKQRRCLTNKVKDSLPSWKLSSDRHTTAHAPKFSNVCTLLRAYSHKPPSPPSPQ